MKKEELEYYTNVEKLNRKEICEKLGCSLGKVDYYYRKYKLKHNFINKEKRDLTGIKVGTFAILSKRNTNSWNCLCDCGRKSVKNHYKIISGNIKCSRCTDTFYAKIDEDILRKYYLELNMSPNDICEKLDISKTTFSRLMKEFSIKRNRTKPFLSQKIGSISVISRIENGKYKFLCDCGKIFVSRHSHVTKLKTKKCSECRSKKYHEIYGIIPKSYWNTIITGAQSRGIEFNLTPIEASNIFNGKCSLTGVEICFLNINKNILEQTASLDRIDSSVGYNKDNIQWLHKDINRLKNKYSQKDFLIFVKQIYEFKNLIEFKD